MTKEEFRRYILSAEGEELPKLTPKEAFEAAKRGDLSAYDLAGRKVACALLRFFERHPEINPQDTYCIAEERGEIQIDEVLDEQARREIDAIGPTGTMFGWGRRHDFGPPIAGRPPASFSKLAVLGSVKWLLEK